MLKKGAGLRADSADSTVSEKRIKSLEISNKILREGQTNLKRELEAFSENLAKERLELEASEAERMRAEQKTRSLQEEIARMKRENEEKVKGMEEESSTKNAEFEAQLLEARQKQEEMLATVQDLTSQLQASKTAKELATVKIAEFEEQIKLKEGTTAQFELEKSQFEGRIQDLENDICMLYEKHGKELESLRALYQHEEYEKRYCEKSKEVNMLRDGFGGVVALWEDCCEVVELQAKLGQVSQETYDLIAEMGGDVSEKQMAVAEVEAATASLQESKAEVERVYGLLLTEKEKLVEELTKEQEKATSLGDEKGLLEAEKVDLSRKMEKVTLEKEALVMSVETVESQNNELLGCVEALRTEKSEIEEFAEVERSVLKEESIKMQKNIAELKEKMLEQEKQLLQSRSEHSSQQKSMIHRLLMYRTATAQKQKSVQDLLADAEQECKELEKALKAVLKRWKKHLEKSSPAEDSRIVVNVTVDEFRRDLLFIERVFARYLKKF